MRLIWIASLLLLSWTPAAYPCFCVPSSDCPGLYQDGPLFLGTVLAVTDVQGPINPAFLSSRRVRIRVDEVFADLSPDLREIEVLTGRNRGDCGVPFESGQVYLVAASIGQDGLLHVGICGHTRKIDGPDPGVQTLRQKRAGEPIPSLTGRIARLDRTFESSWGTKSPQPLANLPVRVKSEGRIYESQSDTGGIFAFYGLPQGMYKFAPELPAGATLQFNPRGDESERSFDLNAACESHDIDVYPSGSIAGRILDPTNQPLPGAIIYILPAGDEIPAGDRPMYSDFPDEKGSYKFVNIQAGDYVIVVNPTDRQNPAVPYRRTFYPGVHDRASATILSLAQGQQMKNVDLHLQQHFIPRHLAVRVTWADGLSLGGRASVEAKENDHPEATSFTAEYDAKTRIVDLSIRPGQSYQVEAHLVCRYSDEHSSGPGATLRSNTIYLRPDDNRTELLLTFPVNACPDIPGKTLESQ